MSRFLGVLVLVGAGSVLYAAGGAATPEAAFKEFQAAIKAKDADKAWKLLSKDARTELDKAARMMEEGLKVLDKLPEEQRKLAEEQIAKKLGVSIAELKKADGKKLLGLALKNPNLGGKDGLDQVTSATLENVKVEGDKATGTVKTRDKSEPIRFTKEGGSWKITPPGGK